METTANENENENENDVKPDLFEPKSVDFFTALLPFSWMKRWLSYKLSSPAPDEKTAFLVKDGLTYAEAPRIRGKHLYASIMHEKCVLKFDVDTNELVKRIDFDDKVSGLGWLPDGKMLVVAMTRRMILRYDESADECEDYADLSEVTRIYANDMVVDELGNAYVGNFGFDVTKLLDARTTTLVRVDPDRKVHVESTGMFFPNGMVVLPDGKRLLVNETISGKITAFDRDPATGALSNRRVWCDIGAPVDGCCLDSEGCYWTAVPQVGAYKTSGCFARVRPDGDGGGTVVETLGFDRNGLRSCAIACVLGTRSDGTHVLYVVDAETADEKLIDARYGTSNCRIKGIVVDVGPARRPDHPRYNSGYC